MLVIRFAGCSMLWHCKLSLECMPVNMYHLKAVVDMQFKRLGSTPIAGPLGVGYARI